VLEEESRRFGSLLRMTAAAEIWKRYSRSILLGYKILVSLLKAIVS
jgi:hypothetical protein